MKSNILLIIILLYAGSNRLNTMYDYYDPSTNAIETVTQLGFIPGVLYRLQF